jgi:hypothetical protein
MKNLLLLAFLIVSIWSCKKTSEHNLPPDEPFYFKGYINGQFVNWSLTSNPNFKCLYGGGASYRPNSIINDQNFTYYSYGSDIYPVKGIGDSTSWSDTLLIYIHFITPQNPSSFNSVLNYFSPGSKQFAVISRSNPDSVSEGISIEYVQQTGYMSGFGDQGSSNFQSIELKDAPAGKEYTKIWTARFSCKVYEPYGGPDITGYHPTQIIEIKDAEIHVPL